MRTYKTVKRKVEDQVRCDICGSICSVDQIGSEYATLEALWGYGSLRDGTKFDIQICPQCFEEVLDWIKKRRKRYLGCFDYPYETDPLKGQTYPIV